MAKAVISTKRNQKQPLCPICETTISSMLTARIEMTNPSKPAIVFYCPHCLSILSIAFKPVSDY